MKKLNRAALVAFIGLGAACPGDSCIAEGTLVLVPSGLVRIETLRVGDLVYALDVATGELVETAITGIRSSKRECVGVALGEAEPLRCTPDHPLYDPDGEAYAPASEWIEGRRTRLLRVNRDGTPQAESVAHKTVHAGVFEVFDLCVASEHHNYVAGGVLVHNKSLVEETESASFGSTGDNDDTTGDSSSGGDTSAAGDSSEGGSSAGDVSGTADTTAGTSDATSGASDSTGGSAGDSGTAGSSSGGSDTGSESTGTGG